jgi:hypothetical protein
MSIRMFLVSGRSYHGTMETYYIAGLLAELASHGFALSYDSQSRTTSCFVIGLCEHQIVRCKRELRNLQGLAADPMLFAGIWLDVLLETRARRAEGRRLGMRNLQLDSGMHWSSTPTEAYRRQLDFDSLLYKLTVLRSELAWDDFALKTLTDLRARTVQTRETYPANHSPSVADRGRDVLDQRLENADDLLRSLREDTAFTTQLASILLQTVRHMGLAYHTRFNFPLDIQPHQPTGQPP